MRERPGRLLRGSSRAGGRCASETEPASDSPALPAKTVVRMLTRCCER